MTYIPCLELGHWSLMFTYEYMIIMCGNLWDSFSDCYCGEIFVFTMMITTLVGVPSAPREAGRHNLLR